MSVRDQFKRTVCACKLCQVGCRTKPGYLAVGDFERIVAAYNVEDPEKFLLENFVAGEGSQVGKIVDGRIATFNIPTITPRQNDDGTCVFLKDNKCSIHAVSPFGCAYFDSHMKADTAQVVSKDALIEVMDDGMARGPYTKLLFKLAANKKYARPRIERTEAFEGEFARVERGNRPTVKKRPKRMFKKP